MFVKLLILRSRGCLASLPFEIVGLIRDTWKPLINTNLDAPLLVNTRQGARLYTAWLLCW